MSLTQIPLESPTLCTLDLNGVEKSALILTRRQLKALERAEMVITSVKFHALEAVNQRLFDPPRAVIKRLKELLEKEDLDLVARIIKRSVDEDLQAMPSLDPLMRYDGPLLFSQISEQLNYQGFPGSDDRAHECIESIIEYIELLEQHLPAFMYAIGEVVILLDLAEAIEILQAPATGELCMIHFRDASPSAFESIACGNA